MPFRQLLTLALVVFTLKDGAGPTRFSYKPYFDNNSSLNLAKPRVEGTSALIDGGDSRQPRTPFTFDWGDGCQNESFFPAKHTYADTSKSYRVNVTAHYSPGEASQSVMIRFAKPHYAFRRNPSVRRLVQIAAKPVKIGSTMEGYSPPDSLTGFADSDLAVPRGLLEYVLDIGAMLIGDFCNHDVDTRAGTEQIVLKAENAGGAFSLWFAKPMALGANPVYLKDLSGVSSLFHEMGHNVTLNSPAKYRFGGKTDGPMSTIVSETLAQIMQHAACWELLNHPGHYALSPDAIADIRDSAVVSFKITSHAYHDYVAAGCPYATRQSGNEGDPDRTFGTFMTVAYVFIEKAEEEGSFSKPVKRFMALLQTFNERDCKHFLDEHSEGFRATLMPAALSFAFNKDMRSLFRNLHFPIDDAIYNELMSRMK